MNFKQQNNGEKTMKKDNKIEGKKISHSKIFDSLHQQNWIEHIIKSEVYCLDNQVFNQLLNDEKIDIDNIDNQYITDENGENTEEMEFQEVFQWFRVSEWLAQGLYQIGGVVYDSNNAHCEENDFNACWWGRTTFGQSLEMDYIWKELYNFIFSDEDIKNHNQEEQANLTKDNEIKELKHRLRTCHEVMGGQRTQLKRYEEFSKSLHKHNNNNLLSNLEQIAEFMRSDLYYVEVDEDHGKSEDEHYILCDAIEKAIKIVRGLK